MRPAIRILPVLGLCVLSACTAYVDLNLGSGTTGATGSDTGSSGAADITGTAVPTTGDLGGSSGGSTGTGAGEAGTSAGETGPTDPPSCEEPGVAADPAVPVSCKDVLVGTPNAPDGEYTLHAGGDPARPWQAWCLHMDQSPAEYLILAMTGEGSNFSEYVPGGQQYPGTTVRTTYSRVRINPYCFRVELGDSTFSASTGQLLHGRTPVTSMPYAVAADCVGPNSMDGRGNVDLRGTPFTAAPEQWKVGGYVANGVVVPLEDNQVFKLRGGGYCGAIAPHLVPEGDTPVNAWVGSGLQLAYDQ